MKPKDIKAKLKEGHIQAIVTFEVVGSPKKHVEDAIASYVQEVKKQPGILTVDEEFGDAQKQDGKLYSIYHEGEFLFSSLENLMWVCFNFTPASVEIIDMGTNKASERELTNWINDLLSKLHEIALKVKELTGMNKLLITNMNKLIQNAIKLAIDTGATTEETIGKRVGIDKQQLAPFFTGMVAEGTITKKGEHYSRA
ncbi:MAG: hypothetical protein HC945_00720 [Nitrosarchaeum sp.]|nr:hypothetical protein [Nitrosarchaeum sp.]